MSFFAPQRLSCGIVVLNARRELLLCHVTGQNHWDLPKGGIDAGETPRDAALRETREETGLRLDAGQLSELGRYKYTAKKDLHLYATLLPRLDLTAFRCESHYLEHASGRHMPEMDGFGWFGFERIAALCTPKMTAVLRSRIDLDHVIDGLLAAAGVEQTNAEPFMMQLSA